MSTQTRDEGLYDYALREPRLPAPENRENDKIGIPIEARLEMYEMQQLLRQFEKRAYDMFLQNLVKGTSHLSLGQEAVATGFGRVMRPDDFTFATYRGHAHTLARGADPGREIDRGSFQSQRILAVYSATRSPARPVATSRPLLP